MRARMAISYSKITLELREISLKDRPKKLYEASSKGTVPVLITENNQVIDESLNIMLWALKKNAKQTWTNKEMLNIFDTQIHCLGYYSNNMKILWQTHTKKEKYV